MYTEIGQRGDAFHVSFTKFYHSKPSPNLFTLPFMYIASCGIGRKKPIGFRPTGCSSAYIQFLTVYIIAPIHLRCNAFFLQYKPFFSIYAIIHTTIQTTIFQINPTADFIKSMSRHKRFCKITLQRKSNKGYRVSLRPLYF